MSKAPSRLNDRPLSPHMGIWRWHLTMATSILHRASGVALYMGALILTGWVASLAAGPAPFFTYRRLLGSPLGLLVMFGLTAAVFYHLANGIRHLFWDAGSGFEIKTANSTGVVAISFAVVVTVLLWGWLLLGGAA